MGDLKKRYDSVVIDGVRYVPADERPILEQERQEFSRLCQVIWPEAFYDPENANVERFAKRLWPHLQKLNETMGFRS